MTERTRVEIDPNVRVRGNQTRTGLRYVHGPIAVGDDVEVFESEADIVGNGRITEISMEKRLVYLAVEWSSLRERQDDPTPREPLEMPVWAGILSVHVVTPVVRECSWSAAPPVRRHQPSATRSDRPVLEVC